MFFILLFGVLKSLGMFDREYRREAGLVANTSRVSFCSRPSRSRIIILNTKLLQKEDSSEITFEEQVIFCKLQLMHSFM